MINSFICLKNKKEKEGQPDYRLTANLGTKESPDYKDIGVGWKKTSEKGEFISFQLNKPYKDKKGWTLESFVEPQEPQGQPKPVADEVRPWNKKPDERVEEKDRGITAEDIDNRFNNFGQNG